MLRGLVSGLVVAGVLVVAVSTAAAHGAKVVTFKTPSGNIGCIYSTGPDNLRCDIRSGLVPKPPHPQDCGEDYGDSVGVSKTGRPKLLCHGDTALDPNAHALAYGSTIHAGPFICKSKLVGLTCTNAAAHGFFLSRQSYKLF